MTNPVIETNIERILEDHLHNEIQAVRNRIKDLNDDIIGLTAREKKLLSIAEAAGISLEADE